MRAHPLAVYILANARRTVLYVGVTNDLPRRLHQHRTGTGSRFAHRYHADRLVHLEYFDDALLAIRREKQLKAGSRRRKVELIERHNPQWLDLGSVIARSEATKQSRYVQQGAPPGRTGIASALRASQ